MPTQKSEKKYQKTNELRCFISAGEESGDLLGAFAIQRLALLASRENLSLEIAGMGGELMRAQSMKSERLLPMESVQAAGIIELVPSLPRILKMRKNWLRNLIAFRPDVVVLIDFPDFHLSLLKAIQKANVPILYYAPPQAWAWRPQRTEILARYADTIAVLFPFEKAWFERRGIETVFVGHPEARGNRKRSASSKTEKFLPKSPLVALYPGSRANEVRRIFPIQKMAATQLAQKMNSEVRFGIRATKAMKPLISALDEKTKAAGFGAFPFQWIGDNQDVTLAFTAAGTATLQLALDGIPFILTHKIHPITYQLIKRRLTIRSFALPNLLLHRKIADEFLQERASPELICNAALALLRSPEKRQAMRRSFRSLQTLIAPPEGSVAIERVIFNLAKNLSV